MDPVISHQFDRSLQLRPSPPGYCILLCAYPLMGFPATAGFLYQVEQVPFQSGRQVKYQHQHRKP